MPAKYLSLALPFAAITAPLSAQEIVYAPGTGDAEYGSADAGHSADADSGYDNDAGMNKVAGQLSNPAVQDGAAIMVERMAGAIMNIPVDGITNAIETARPGTVKPQLRRNATLGDLAGRDSEYLPEELADQTRATIGMMGGVARAMASMMPAIENLSRDMQDQIRAAKDEARRARDR